MKKLLAFAALFAVVALTSCKYDDDDLWNSVHGLENRVAKLEELCKQMNTNISSLQTIVTALQNNVYVTGTTPLMKDGNEIGYTITFSKGNPITIYHGKDGQDGEDGTTPTIGVKKDTDGVYYWTLNGEFIMVDGGKIQAEGKDGINGTNGTTPQFKLKLTLMVRKIVLSLIAVLVLGAYAFAQNKQVSGTVSDANGNPVAGATVMVDGTSIGTTTNAAGQYSLSAPADGTLSVTFIGLSLIHI